jgi:signal transduction histidine kinase
LRYFGRDSGLSTRRPGSDGQRSQALRADKIDVYAEVDEDSVEVFVRDRGKGFDVETVAEDRMGVKGSIIDRMARHGGSATIRSEPDDGTEVRLEIKR